MKPTATKILHLLTTHCKTKSQIHQIQTHLILNNKFISNSKIAKHFIPICQSLNLLTSNALPLYITNNKTQPDTFTCNTLLKAFCHSTFPDNENCWPIYCYMHKNCVTFNNFTFPFVLKALSDLGFVKDGFLVHAHIVKAGFLVDVYVGNSLLNFYGSRNGDMGMCVKVFDEMPVRDVVSWTTLMSGFKEAGWFHEALGAFERMRGEGVVPNRVTAVCVLDMCACIGAWALDMGVCIHEHVKRSGWELDVILGTSLVDLYGKCGRIDEALRVFGEMSVKNVFTWNAIISGLAVSQSGERAIELFDRMGEEGVEPDEVTLVSVLSACVHSGNLHVGRVIFSSLLNGKFGFPPNVKHYACMIDLLSRLRCLDEAFRMIDEMPFEPTVSIWGSLLAGCRAQANHEMSEIAAWKLVELEPQNSAYYVMLSNMYADVGKWSDVEKVRELMKERGLKKVMGSSGLKFESQEHAYELLA